MIPKTKKPSRSPLFITSPLRWRLIIIVDAGRILSEPRAFVLDPSIEANIGRAPESTVVLDDEMASKVHASMRWRAGRWEIADRGSTNGVLVNGRRTAAKQLDDGDVINLGETIAVLRLGRTIPESDPPLGMIGQSHRAQLLFRELNQIAGDEGASVLLLGEVGVGKNGCAMALHQMSRPKGPFMEINCAAVPPDLLESELFGHERGAFTGAQFGKQGLIEAADGGTLFLDEIGELSGSAQSKLLSFLESRRFRRLGSTRTLTADVLVIAATNRDLSRRGARFRDDLYSRLARPYLWVPAIRDRREDIPLLIAHLFGKPGPNKWVIPEVLHAMTVYSWSRANIRELKEFVDRLRRLRPDADFADIQFLREFIEEHVDLSYEDLNSSGNGVVRAQYDGADSRPIIHQRSALQTASRVILRFLEQHEAIRAPDVQRLLDVGERHARRILSELEREGILIRFESGNDVYYMAAPVRNWGRR